MRDRSWRTRKALRSSTMRASAGRGSVRASRPVMPGRCSDSAASIAPPSAAGRPTGSTPSSTSREARMASGVSTTSWPPKTRSPSAGRPAWSKLLVTSPVGSASPAATAAAPVKAVVATDPRPPTSHTPTLESPFMFPSDPPLNERSAVHLLVSRLHFMLSVKTKYVSCFAKQIFCLVSKGMVRALALTTVLCLTAACGGGTAAAPAQKRFRALVFTKTTGFRHTSIDEGARAVRTLGRNHRFLVDTTADPRRFTRANLARYDVVVFMSTTGTPIARRSQQRAFEHYIHRGGGFVGVHAASDTRGKWPWYDRLVGARFKRHDP